ncbi:MAG: hypothetical protein K5840_01420 [Eubacterium sp.]|nr:hypothetical protein [Eubacterium sp.]
MLFDVIIRSLAALEILFLLNADGITTTSVVVSVCVFLFLEVTLLMPYTRIADGLFVLTFAFGIGYLFATGAGSLPLKVAFLLFGAVTLGLCTYLHRTMMTYRQQLYRARDNSREVESSLRTRNRALLSEQDQQVHMATLNERNRIAREIHDNVGHMLSRAILLLGAIQTVNRDDTLKPQLSMLADTLDESMEKMRESVHDLHDDSIDLERNFGEIIGELSGFRVSKDLDFDEELPKIIKLSLIGILKEAVTNILKHSSGDSVTIIMHQNRSFCTLSVSDNGTVDAETKRRIETTGFEGIGLSNIRERAGVCGGDVYFYTENGFTVFARLPYPDAGENKE